MTDYLDLHSDVSICTFNCRSIKSSTMEVKNLCESHDIVAIQEHWLLPFELDILSNIHVDFLSAVTSAVNISKNVLVGRPYGGTAILYNKKFASSVTVIDTLESRCTAIILHTNVGPVLLVNVYMPTDYGNFDSYEEYNELCAKITAMYNDANAVYLMVLGDFNCSLYSRFYPILSQFMSDNDLIYSDLTRLHDAFTYCRDDGQNTSWIDHLLCSKV